MIQLQSERFFTGVNDVDNFIGIVNTTSPGSTANRL